MEENKVSGEQIQVRETRGLEEHRGRGKEGNIEMSDEPAEVVEEERTKPKKKKTPEEIEAGKKELTQTSTEVYCSDDD